MSQQLLEWAKQALEMLEDNHHLVADNEKHAYVMLHLEVIEKGKALLEQSEPVQERSCGNCKHLHRTVCVGCHDGIHNRWEPTTPPAQPAPVQEPVAELMHEPDVEVLRQQMKGRAQFLRDRGEVKTPQLLEIASELITPPAAQPADHCEDVLHMVAAAWVGLTDKEINNLRYKPDWSGPWTDMAFARAIEAKLREKNGGGHA
jgi:hypothetical protein